MAEVTWLRSHCDICGGLGAAVEMRLVGDVMVDEAGHQWISPVRGRATDQAGRMKEGFGRKLAEAEPNHPWFRVTQQTAASPEGS